MDVLSLVGLLVAFTSVLVGNALEGGHTSSLVQLTAFIIVMGGTLGAVMLQTPLTVFTRSMRMLAWVLLPPRLDGEATIRRVIDWSQTARKDGLLGLETNAEEESDPFVAKGLQLLVDGSEPDMIRHTLEVDLDSLEERDTQAAKVFESMGGYSPTVGILGAVLGLIHVMENLADPSKLGSGIAVAFVATVYGVGFANLLFLPVGNKLKAVVARQSRQRDMVLEGLASISRGDNPRAIETRLRGFLL